MTQDNTDSSSRQALMYLLFPESRFLGDYLQTAQTWANAGVVLL